MNDKRLRITSAGIIFPRPSVVLRVDGRFVLFLWRQLARVKGIRCAVGLSNDYPVRSALGVAPALGTCADDLPIARPDSLHDSFKHDGHRVVGS